jgi:hypothetical protein
MLGIRSGAPLVTSCGGGVHGVVEGLALGGTLGPPLGAYSVPFIRKAAGSSTGIHCDRCIEWHWEASSAGHLDWISTGFSM